jgi:hypothetical protein
MTDSIAGEAARVHRTADQSLRPGGVIKMTVHVGPSTAPAS